MNAILFTKVGGRSLAVQLHRARCYVPLALGFLVLCGALLQTGYRIGKAAAPGNTATASGSEQSLAQAQINTLAQRMGQLRAQVQRLEALGQRLSQVAGINPDDFSLASAPAMGGQQARIAETAPSLNVMQQALGQLSQFIDLRERRLTVLEHLLAEPWLYRSPTSPFGEPASPGPTSLPVSGNASDPLYGLKQNSTSGIDFAGPRRHRPIVADGRRGGELCRRYVVAMDAWSRSITAMAW